MTTINEPERNLPVVHETDLCVIGGSCTGVYWYGAGETTYTTGLIAPAIAEYATRFGGGPGAVAVRRTLQSTESGGTR